MQKTRLGLYASSLNIPLLIGCNRYVQGVAQPLADFLQNSCDLNFFGPKPIPTQLKEQLKISPQEIDSYQSFQNQSNKSQIDLWHLLTDAPTPFKKIDKPFVVTCHGLTVFHLMNQTAKREIPGHYWDYLDFAPNVHNAIYNHSPINLLKRPFYKNKVKKIHNASIDEWKTHLLQAEKIISVSHFVKNEIQESFKIPEKKLTVIHESASEDFSKPIDKTTKQALREKYKLPERYILCVTNLHLVKNVKGLFQLAKFLKEKTGLRLVYAYLHSPYEERYLSPLKELGLKENQDIWLLQNIPQEDIKTLLHDAYLFVNLAWIETFGLPIVEALKSGLPILSSDRCALGEVLGSGGFSFDPNSIHQLFDKILELESDNEKYLQLKEKALNRAKDFSWRKNAKETIQVYEEVLQTPLLLDREK